MAAPAPTSEQHRTRRRVVAPGWAVELGGALGAVVGVGVGTLAGWIVGLHVGDIAGADLTTIAGALLGGVAGIQAGFVVADHRRRSSPDD